MNENDAFLLRGIRRPLERRAKVIGSERHLMCFTQHNPTREMAELNRKTVRVYYYESVYQWLVALIRYCENHIR